MAKVKLSKKQERWFKYIAELVVLASAKEEGLFVSDDEYFYHQQKTRDRYSDILINDRLRGYRNGLDKTDF